MKIICLPILFVSVLFAQVEDSHKVASSFQPAVFLDVANYQSDSDPKTRVDVFIQVPYSSLQFLKYNDIYQAKYSITITFYDSDKENIVFERVWTEKITSNSFEDTQSKLNFNISYETLQVDPGDYFLSCYIEDLDSKKSINIERQTNVRKFDNAEDISDIMFIRDVVKDAEGDRIIPSISHMFTSMDKKLSFFYEVYSDADKKILIHYIIKDKDQNDISVANSEYTLNEGKNVLFGEITNTKFSLGEYKLFINISDSLGNDLHSIDKPFNSKIFGFPNSIQDLDKAIDQLIYIASASEIDQIKSIENFDDKLSRFVGYWKGKDPSPNTLENEVLAEYYRRVDFANQNFKNYLEGWRTDMGMVYITLGPPDAVERSPFDVETKPYEMWDYYQINKRFVFVDQTGFGDYRLINPEYGEWYRYRY